MNAYLQKTVESLSAVFPLQFSQPLFGFREYRLRPFLTPTNLGVDGSDIFSLEGIEYYKRVGAEHPTRTMPISVTAACRFNFKMTMTRCCSR